MIAERKITKPEQFGHVAVAMGGTSAEREISLKGGHAVLNALVEQGINAIAIDIDNNPIRAFKNHQFDRVFNMIHGRGGEDGVLQAIMESMELAYTGSGVLGSALSMDKLRTKLCWQAKQLPTPAYVMLETKQDVDTAANQLEFPVMIKPVREGSSIGMNKVSSPKQLLEAWQQAREFDHMVMAEQWITGNEYTVAIIDNQALPLIRLQTPNEFYDYQAKYCANTTQYHCPSGLSQQQETELQQLAVEASRIVDVSGWCRVDVFVDETKQPWLIEVNTVPGMTDHSLVPMAAKAIGMDFNELVWRILETSINTDQYNEMTH
jgi:D-alanine-D-alanine ligase